MRGLVTIDEPAEFDRWMAEQVAAAQETGGDNFWESERRRRTSSGFGLTILPTGSGSRGFDRSRSELVRLASEGRIPRLLRVGPRQQLEEALEPFRH